MPRFAPRHVAAGVAGLAGLLGLIDGTEYFVNSALAGSPIPWWKAFGFELFKWLTWAALVPAIAAGVRLAAGRPLWPLGMAWHLVAAFAFTLLQVTVYALFVEVLVEGARGAAIGRAILVFLTNKSAAGVITYLGIVAGVLAFGHARRSAERERTAEALRADLAGARLEALRLQLQPHFLFNALGAVSAAVDAGDEDTARRMLARIGALLRRTLDAGEGETTLEEELVLLDHYLDVERARFGGALRVSLDVDERCLAARVPTLILQPLVENAIRHTTQARPSVSVEVGARSEGGELSLWVTDDGPGFSGAGEREGLGLANTRARLEHAYGERGHLEVGGGAGARVALRLPLVLASA